MRFYQAGLERLDGAWAGKSSPGTEFLDPHHPYASDLDLFGVSSLFELLNTAQTQSGRATLAAWRGRGIYKATVAYRAGLAAGRGYGLLEVDASDDSRPILERLGFVPVTTTTPFVWSPATTGAG